MSKEGFAMITLKDVAAECRVSVSTVSRALNGSSVIRPDLAASIRETADRMGYQPNEVARSLKLNRTWMIGILHDEALDHPFFSGMLEALRKSAERRGCDTVFLSRRQRNNLPASSDIALSRRLDGIIVAYADVAEDSLDRLMSNQIPVVSVDDCSRPCPIIASDYENGTRILTEEALRRGRRRLAFIHGEPGVSTSRRIAGFQAALAARGLGGELIPGTFNSGDRCAELLLNRLEGPNPPDCFLLPDDTSALHALLRLRRAGIRVPEDTAVAGFDGQRWACSMLPELTTFRQNLEKIAESALDKLLTTRASGIDRSRSEIIIPGCLVPGETL